MVYPRRAWVWRRRCRPCRSTLHVEPRSAKRQVRRNRLHDAELRDDVVDVALCVVWLMERRETLTEATFTMRGLMMRFQEALEFLREVVMKGANPGRLMGMKTVFRSLGNSVRRGYRRGRRRGRHAPCPGR